MKINYLEDGSPDCPIIMITDCNNDDYILLHKKFRNGISFSIKDKYSNVRIDFIISEEANIGIKMINNHLFNCFLTKDEFMKISNLINSFMLSLELDKQINKHQWLNEDSDISLLLSENGKW